MKKTELKEYKLLLLALQARIRGDVAQLTDEALTGHDGAAGQNSPTHIAELGTDTYEQDFALRFVENDQELLNEIAEALVRIENGTYGQCVACLEAGKTPAKAAIPKTRLKAIPYAKNCVVCERKREELSI